MRGVLFGFAEENNNYLQTTGFYVPQGDTDAASALAAWLEENYGGYTVNIGLPAENTTIAAALSLGFQQHNRYRCYAKVL